MALLCIWEECREDHREDPTRNPYPVQLHVKLRPSLARPLSNSYRLSTIAMAYRWCIAQHADKWRDGMGTRGNGWPALEAEGVDGRAARKSLNLLLLQPVQDELQRVLVLLAPVRGRGVRRRE